MSDKEDKDLLVMGPELSSGARAVLKITKDEVYAGSVYPEDKAPEEANTRITTKSLGGSVYEIVSEEPIGKPARVNSRAFRENWDTIFGQQSVIGSA